MAWSSLATQYSLELAFGLSLGLCMLARAPMGLFFFRMMGTTAILPVLLAIGLPLYTGQAKLSNAFVFAGLAAVLGYPLLSGPVKARTRLAAQLWSTLWIALALVALMRAQPEMRAWPSLLLCGASALATGAVAGGVGLAMVVGHWYLTVPELPIEWLQKLNRLTALAMLCSLALLALTCFVFREELGQARSPLLGPWGVLQLGARIATGLALPLLFAWMTAGSLAWKNTRSATGILYASTVLVLIGTAVSVSLQSTYGIPL